MTIGVAEAELLREEVAELRAALAARGADLAKKDEALTARDQVLAEMAEKLRITAEERDYLERRLFGRSSETFLVGPALFHGLGAPEDGPAAKETAPDDPSVPTCVRHPTPRSSV